MLFGKLLTNTAPGFADVRTYWSPEAVERVTGWKPEGLAEGRLHPPDQLRRGHAGRLRRSDDDQRQAVMKPWWDITAKRRPSCLDATTVVLRPTCVYFRGGGYLLAPASRAAACP